MKNNMIIICAVSCFRCNKMRRIVKRIKYYCILSKGTPETASHSQPILLVREVGDIICVLTNRPFTSQKNKKWENRMILDRNCKGSISYRSICHKYYSRDLHTTE